jgi:hypothetical protein
MIRYALGALTITLNVATLHAEDANKKPPENCSPQPQCQVLISPLTPGAPTMGIRDKAFIGRATESATKGHNRDEAQ